MSTPAGGGPGDQHSPPRVAGVATVDGVVDEARLIASVRRGDTAVYAELYCLHVADVTALARRLCRDRHEADDVVSDVFCNALRALQNGAGPTDSLKPYLLRSVRNSIIDLRTRGDSGRAVPEPSDRLDRADAADSFDAPGAAAVAFNSVSSRHQRVLWSVEVEGTPTTALAEVEDVSAPAAASLAYRARCALRRAYVGASLDTPASATCRPYRSLIPSLVDGGLGPKKTRLVGDHCRDCTDCAKSLEAARSIRARLSDRAWWSLAPLGLRAMAINTGRSLLGAVTAAPAATTAAVVAGAALVGLASVAVVEGDDEAPTSEALPAAEATAGDDAVVAPSPVEENDEPNPGDPAASSGGVAGTGVDPDAATTGPGAEPGVADEAGEADGAVGETASPTSGIVAPTTPADLSGLTVVADPDLAAVLTAFLPESGELAEPGLPGGLDEVVGSVDGVSEVLDPITDPLREQVVDPITDTVTGAVGQVTDTVGQTTDPVVGPVVDAVTPVTETLDPVTETLDDVTDTVDDVIDTVVPVVVPAADPVPDPPVVDPDPVLDVVGSVDPLLDTVVDTSLDVPGL